MFVLCVSTTPLLRQDNAPVHKALIAKAGLIECGFEELLRAPYSPDLALCDFHLFPTLKGHLRWKHFEDYNELKTATKNWSYGQDKTFYFEWNRKATFGLLSTKSTFFIFDGPSKLRQTSFIEMRTFLFWLNPKGHSKLHNTSVELLVIPCTRQCMLPPLLPTPLFSCPGQRKRRRPVPVPVIGVRYNSLL